MYKISNHVAHRLQATKIELERILKALEPSEDKPLSEIETMQLVTELTRREYVVLGSEDYKRLKNERLAQKPLSEIRNGELMDELDRRGYMAKSKKPEYEVNDTIFFGHPEHGGFGTVLGQTMDADGVCLYYDVHVNDKRLRARPNQLQRAEMVAAHFRLESDGFSWAR